MNRTTRRDDCLAVALHSEELGEVYEQSERRLRNVIFSLHDNLRASSIRPGTPVFRAPHVVAFERVIVILPGMVERYHFARNQWFDAVDAAFRCIVELEIRKEEAEATIDDFFASIAHNYTSQLVAIDGLGSELRALDAGSTEAALVRDQLLAALDAARTGIRNSIEHAQRIRQDILARSSPALAERFRSAESSSHA